MTTIRKILGLESAIPEQGQDIENTENTEQTSIEAETKLVEQETQLADAVQEPVVEVAGQTAPTTEVEVEVTVNGEQVAEVATPEETPADTPVEPTPTEQVVETAGETIPEEGQDPASEEGEQAEASQESESDDDEDEDDDDQEKLSQELSYTIQAGDDINKTIVTLETIATILNNAPEEQINETTAAIVAAAIDQIDDHFEVEKAVEVSVESFNVLGAKTYKAKAQEAISDKVKAYKDGLKKTLYRIKEILATVKSHLSNDHRKLVEKLDGLTDKLVQAKGKRQIKTKIFWGTIVGEKFTLEDIYKKGEILQDSVNGTTKFISNSFKKNNGQLEFLSTTDQFFTLARQSFPKAKVQNRELTIYENIGGNKLSLNFNEDNQFFKVETKKTSKADLPAVFELTDSDVKKFFKQAKDLGKNVTTQSSDIIDLVDTNIDKMDETDSVPEEHLIKMSDAVNSLSYGCFTRSMRYVIVLTEMIESYLAVEEK